MFRSSPFNSSRFEYMASYWIQMAWNFVNMWGAMEHDTCRVGTLICFVVCPTRATQLATFLCNYLRNQNLPQKQISKNMPAETKWWGRRNKTAGPQQNWNLCLPKCIRGNKMVGPQKQKQRSAETPQKQTAETKSGPNLIQKKVACFWSKIGSSMLTAKA